MNTVRNKQQVFGHAISLQGISPPQVRTNTYHAYTQMSLTGENMDGMNAVIYVG